MNSISIKILLILFLPCMVFAQNLYFARENYIDTNLFASSVSELSKQIIEKFSDPDVEIYYDNLFRLQIVAGDFTGAQNSIIKIREIFGKEKWEGNLATGIQFESYARTKELQKTDTRTFEELYPVVLAEMYNRLPDEAKIFMNSFFFGDIDSYRDKWMNVVNELNKKQSDSVDIEKAIELCYLYNSYLVYSKVKNAGLVFLEVQDSKRYIVEDSVLITTARGVEIAALVVRDKYNDVSKPVILRYDIYAGRTEMSSAKYIVSKGYTAVIAYTRGKYLSHHEIEPFEHDAEDSYDIIDWISKQPWCDGRVGMYGGSYLGFSQWSAVKNLHPALKTIVPQVSVGIGVDYPQNNGVFMSYMLRWIHYVTNLKLTDYPEFSNWQKWEELYKSWYTSGKSFRALDSMDNRPNGIFQRWLDHPMYDSYWQSMVPYKDEFAKINIPVLTTTGYFDVDQRGAFYYFDQHNLYNPKAEHYVLIGPYNHPSAASYAFSYISGYTIDKIANINISEIVFQWFDYIFKSKPKPQILKDKINYQVMCKNVWKHSPSYDKMINDTLALYFTPVKSGSFYTLDQKPGNDYIKQTIDYANRSDSAESKSFHYSMIEDTVLYTGECLKFISMPFDDSLEINGSFFGDVILSINKKDIDIFVDLYELMPDGRYFCFSNFLARASYIKDRSKRTLLTPGKWEKVPINNSFFTSRMVRKGSRIVAVLGMYKRRDWQINYGTGKDVSDESIADGRIPLEIKWSYKSNVKLPVYRYR